MDRNHCCSSVIIYQAAVAISQLNPNTSWGDEIVRGNAVAGRATALREAVALTVAPRPVHLWRLAVARNPSLLRVFGIVPAASSRPESGSDVFLKSTGWQYAPAHSA